MYSYEFSERRLSLNYYTRLNKLEDDSFISAALQEQKALNLSWYKNIEPLLKLDNIYFEDHVTAHRILNHKSSVKATHSHPIPPSLRYLKCAVPLPSKQYRVNKISDVLLNHFKACWEHEKSISPKLSYYHSIKKRFARESYLDLAHKFPHRYSTTKLRISSHDLEIENGRYQKVPRDQRICSWCKKNSGQEIMEDEKHFLFNCDLYTKLRSSVINSINNSPAIIDTPAINLTQSSLDLNLMSLLSPNTVLELDSSTTDQFNQHHTNLNLKPKSPAHTSLVEARSHIINKVCCFINRCFDERWKFLKDAKNPRKNKSNTHIPKTIIINVTQ